MERLLFGILIKKIEKVIDLGDGWIENLSWSQDGEMLAVSCSRTVLFTLKRVMKCGNLIIITVPSAI